MQFIKKNYEKILLGLVLIGGVVISVFMLLMVSNEKSAQTERTNKNTTGAPRPLQPPELTRADELNRKAATPVMLSLSDSTHKLFNPERWQKAADGRLVKNPAGVEPKIEITRITNLNFTISLANVAVSDSGPRYTFMIEQQAASRPAGRGKVPKYGSKGEK